MTNMNQSFIRAFAKKDASVTQSTAASAGAKKVTQRAPISVTQAEAGVAAPAKIQAVSPTPANIPPSVAALLSSESVLVYSDFSAPLAPLSDENRGSKSTWTPEIAEAAQSAVAEVPREVGKKSKIPLPPPSAVEPPLEVRQAVQRIDEAHRTKSILPKITPAWEVDKLLWPRTCDQLLAAERTYFEEAARRLVEASSQGMRTLAVCASRRGEGCSTVALCVAKAAAMAGLRIGIVDADFQSDGLSELLGLEVECNWTAAAEDPSAIHENSVQVLDQSITLFPVSRNVTKAVLQQSTKPLSLLTPISDQFDLLIVDFGAFNEGMFPGALKSKVEIDAALVVRDLRHTSSRGVQITVGQIRDAGIEAVGIAENFGAR